MVTWAGAFVEVSRRELEALAPEHRLELVERKGASHGRWQYVEASVNGAHLKVPRFSQELSRALHCNVVGFSLQSTSSIEDVEHFEDGVLVRKLTYSGDEGGWMESIGPQQAWESAYFFAPDEGVGDAREWPSNLDDGISDADFERYREARRQKDASSILDLLSAGSRHSIMRLAGHFGVDLKQPDARFTPPTNWKPRLILAGITLVIIGALVAGALTSPPRPSGQKLEILE
jgi:hypothetical protein